MDTERCLHLVLDAGHISVNSALGDKSELQQLQTKRGQVLAGDEIKHLEGLMYDRFSLKLESTQVSHARRREMICALTGLRHSASGRTQSQRLHGSACIPYPVFGFAHC